MNNGNLEGILEVMKNVNRKCLQTYHENNCHELIF